MLRRGISIVVAFALATAALGVAPKAADAASMCSGYACDGKRPVTDTNCGVASSTNNVFTVAGPATIMVGYTPLASVEMRYSSACQTVWSLVSMPTRYATGWYFGYAVGRTSPSYRVLDPGSSSSSMRCIPNYYCIDKLYMPPTKPYQGYGEMVYAPAGSTVWAGGYVGCPTSNTCVGAPYYLTLSYTV